jgi:hypothetical protein
VTTATATDPLAAARERLDAARQERAELGVEARAWETEIANAAAELDHLANTDREQFGPDGQPRPKTRAAELRRKIEDSRSTLWPDVLRGSDRRVIDADANLKRVTAANAVELALGEFRAGEAELEELDAYAEAMLEVIARVTGRSRRLIEIAAACSGIDGRSVVSDDRIERLGKLLSEHETFTPPRIAYLTPFVGENPRVVRGRQDGWIGAEHGSDNFHDEQPARIEPRR